MHDLEKEPFFSELDFQITDAEIDKALKRLNTNSSPGPDRISGAYLLIGKAILTPALKLFFNKMFSSATQANIFSFNFLKPIFKKGDPSDPDKYRGIAIGSTIAKVFDLIILQRLESQVSRTNPLSLTR